MSHSLHLTNPISGTLAVAAFWLCTVSTSMAGPWFFEPAVTVFGGFDDNPGLEADGPIASGDGSGEDTIAADPAATGPSTSSQSFVAIGADFLLETQSDLNTLTLALDSEFRRYDDSSLDTEVIDSSINYVRNLERNELTASIGYAEESTISSSLAEGDIGLIGGDIDRNTIALGGGFSSNISESVTSSINIAFDQVTFDEDNPTEVGADLTDFEQTTLSFSVENAFTERFSASIGLELIDFRPTSDLVEGDISKEESLGLVLGGNYLIKPNLELILSIAPTETTTTEFGSGETRDSSIERYELGLEYSGFENSFSLSIANALTASSLGRLVETDLISASWTKINTFGGTFQSSVSFGQEQSEDDTEDLSGNREFFDFGLTYQRSINRNISWYLEYLYRRSETVLNLEADSNSIIGGLEYRWGRRLL